MNSTCENSAYNFSTLIKYLESNKYIFVNNISYCDLIVVNTCVVSDKLIDSCEFLIKNLSDIYPSKKIVLFGCISGFKQKFKQNQNIRIIKSIKDISLKDVFKGETNTKNISSYKLYNYKEHQSRISNSDNFILISQGCINNCSYCNIKITKGFVKSRTIKDIKKDISILNLNSVSEVTLLGDDCGSYGMDINQNFSKLLDKIDKGFPNIKLKIYTIFPSLFLKHKDIILDLIKKGKITYICIPVQSGSKKILKLMNRDYDLNLLIKCLLKIKYLNPKTHLFTHIIINFPKESISDFQKSMSIAKYFDEVLFLKYCDNSNTKANLIRPKCDKNEFETKYRLLTKTFKNNIKRINGKITFITLNNTTNELIGRPCKL